MSPSHKGGNVTADADFGLGKVGNDRHIHGPFSPGTSAFLAKTTRESAPVGDGTAHAPADTVESLAWSQPKAARPFAHDRAQLISDRRQAPIVFWLFILIQVLDGALTYWGVTRFGIELEMNALLSSWMHEVGPATTLLAAKALACSCGVILYNAQYHRPLAAVAGLCLGIAVIPWAYLAVSIG